MMTEAEAIEKIRRRTARWGWRLFRINTGAAMNPSGRLLRFGLPGMSDIIGLTNKGQFVAIEVKMRSTRVSPQQQKFGEVILKCGGIFRIIRVG